jgi:amidase
MPHRLTLAAMCELIRSRKISATELVDAHLSQIARHNQNLNAFVIQFPEEARTSAREADQHAPKGLLHGIPMTVKDSFDIQGLPTLCGSKFRLAHKATRDSTAVARLRAAGAIMLGKTNCPEFLFNYETDNYITGRTNNPWNLSYTAGGSSGGEAAAVSAFCSAGGIGSDGGGSIRVPAHFCGIAGLKPTPGRVPAVGHYPEINHPGGLLGVAGPIARNVKDVRILFEVLQGYDPADPFSAPIARSRPELENLNVGIIEQMNDTPVQSEVKDALHATARLLQDTLRIPAVPFSTQGLEQAAALWWFFFAEISAPFTRDIVNQKEGDAHWTGMELLNMVPEGKEISARSVVENLGSRDRMRAAFLQRLVNTPLLIAPACGVTAFPHQQREWQAGGRSINLLEAMAPVTPFNLLGLPSLVLPIHITNDGIPVGVQLIGRPYEEELLLAVGEKLEEARGPFPAPPGFAH